MPRIIANGKIFEVTEGTNLRLALLSQNIDLYSSGAKIFNCQGKGICSTCRVQIEGKVSKPTVCEMKRLDFPSHFVHKDRQLSCQVNVLGDVRITRFDGYSGDGNQVIWSPEIVIATTNDEGQAEYLLQGARSRNGFIPKERET